VGAVGWEPGDIFLICSDGLTEGLYNHHLLDLLRSAQPGPADDNPARRLVLEAVKNDGRDNTTALVIEVV
jgi:protein phosphatase